LEFQLNAIEAIAWTIQTNIGEDNIEKIVRQGDCIMIKPKNTKDAAGVVRHLTEKEYTTLLVAES
jgi:sulfate adenylyltransferase subunit 1 (EFTu-like GTPase family)